MQEAAQQLALPVAKHLPQGAGVSRQARQPGGTRESRFDGIGLSVVYSSFDAAIGRWSQWTAPSPIPAHERRGSHQPASGAVPGSGAPPHDGRPSFFTKGTGAQ